MHPVLCIQCKRLPPPLRFVLPPKKVFPFPKIVWLATCLQRNQSHVRKTTLKQGNWQKVSTQHFDKQNVHKIAPGFIWKTDVTGASHYRIHRVATVMSHPHSRRDGSEQPLSSQPWRWNQQTVTYRIITAVLAGVIAAWRQTSARKSLLRFTITVFLSSTVDAIIVKNKRKREKRKKTN